MKETSRKSAKQSLAGTNYRSGDDRSRVSLQRSESTLSPRQGNVRLTKWVLAVCLALTLITIVVYAPLRNYGFISLDDPQYVSENPHISGGLTWSSVAWAFTTVHASYWIPPIWLSHMLDVQLYGKNAGGHHVTNIVFHIANTLLLFGLFYRTTSGLYRSAFVAALFAIHPLHVESVAWITERKDMLSAFFFLLALWAYVAYVAKPRPRRYVWILVFFALGLMSKPMIVTLPFILLLLDFWPLQRLSLKPINAAKPRSRDSRVWRTEALRLVREKFPLFALAATSSLATYLSQQATGAVVGLDVTPLGLRFSNAMVSYFVYIEKMFWPTRLALFYPYPVSIPASLVIGSVLGLVVVSALAIWKAPTRPYLVTGWFWYLGSLVPVIGFVQAGTQSMADRFTYIPLIGLFIVAAWAIPDLSRDWSLARIPVGAAILALAVAAILASIQVRYWRNGFALWEHTLEVTNENYIAQTNLGIAYSEAGKDSDAVAHYTEALRIKPNFAEAHNDLGVALANQGRIKEGVQEFLEALRIKPDQLDSHYNAGVLLRQMGNTTEALDHFAAALALDPNHQDARREYDNLRRRTQ